MQDRCRSLNNCYLLLDSTVLFLCYHHLLLLRQGVFQLLDLCFRIVEIGFAMLWQGLLCLCLRKAILELRV